MQDIVSVIVIRMSRIMDKLSVTLVYIFSEAVDVSRLSRS